MQYSYYPGCSLERNARSYHESTMAVADALGLELAEVADWNCCGATEYMSLDLLPAYALVARNLALAAAEGSPGRQLVAPCSACFLNLSKTNRHMADSPTLARQVNEALAAGDLSYEPDSLRVRHLLEIFVDDVGLPEIAGKVTQPLTGLKVAPYYGCLIVRPAYNGRFDDPEYPETLDNLVSTLGAEAVDFALRADCCGGHMTQISERVALNMLRHLLQNATDAGADLLVTLCPMCQLNLDAYQGAVNRQFDTDFNLPILYFTQLMGLAFGLPDKLLGLGREFVDAGPAIAKIGTALPQARRQRPSKKALPMPEARS